jgi:hypothetical protein
VTDSDEHSSLLRQRVINYDLKSFVIKCPRGIFLTLHFCSFSSFSAKVEETKNRKKWLYLSRTVVDHITRKPKIKGSNLAITTEREKLVE